MPCCILCCLPTSQAVLKCFRRVSAILVFHCYEKDKAEQSRWFSKISLARVASGLQSTSRLVFKTNLFVDCRPLATLSKLILVTQHTMRSVNGSTAVWKSLVQNSEANWARDKSIASKRSVGEIANRVNGDETATFLLWISGGIEAECNFPAELFALSDGHSGNHCSALSFS